MNSTRRHSGYRTMPRLRRATLDGLLDLGAAVGVLDAIAVLHALAPDEPYDAALLDLFAEYVEQLDDKQHAAYARQLFDETLDDDAR